MHENSWTQVRSTSSRMEAEMLRDLLSAHGIVGLVQPSDASAYLGVLSACRLLVREHDAGEASSYLDAWEEAGPREQDAIDHDVSDDDIAPASGE